MRILSVNKFYYIKGGCERYLFGLNRMLRAQGHQIIPFSMEHPENEKSQYSSYFVSQADFFSSGGVVDKIKAGLNVTYSREARQKIETLIKDTQPQIAHLHNIAHQLSPSILYGLQKHNIPIVQTLHDFKLVCPTYTMYTQSQVCERCLTGQYYNALRYRCNKGSLPVSAINVVEMYLHNSILHSYDKVDAFIAPSAFLRNKMIEGGVVPERIHHIPNFIRVSDYTPHYQNDGYLLFFGQLITVKGLDILLQAMQEFPDIRLVVAGRGADKKRYESYARGRNLNVSFVGFQSGDALCKLIQNSLVVVVPSVWYENLPYTILESFAYGKPVIASNLGGMAELVTDGETGYLFEAGNPQDLAAKIRKALANSTKLPEMGRVARAKIEREFNPDLHLERITKLYKRFV